MASARPNSKPILGIDWSSQGWVILFFPEMADRNHVFSPPAASRERASGSWIPKGGAPADFESNSI